MMKKFGITVGLALILTLTGCNTKTEIRESDSVSSDSTPNVETTEDGSGLVWSIVSDDLFGYRDYH